MSSASFLVGDTSSRFPKSLKFLHFGGLAASDNLFNVTPAVDASAKVGEPPKTHLSQLVALRLDQCPRVTVNGLFGALRQRSLPSMLRLHVYWLDNEVIKYFICRHSELTREIPHAGRTRYASSRKPD